jgi:inhibitor of cysteine peptidase
MAHAPAEVVCRLGRRGRQEEVVKPMLSLVEADNGRTVDIRRGETVRISLPENASTGYRWAIDRFDEQLIEALTTEPLYPSDRVGSSGDVAFTFRPKEVGAGEVVLKHWRHWEGDSSVTTRFRVRLQVRP